MCHSHLCCPSVWAREAAVDSAPLAVSALVFFLCCDCHCSLALRGLEVSAGMLGFVLVDRNFGRAAVMAVFLESHHTTRSCQSPVKGSEGVRLSLHMLRPFSRHPEELGSGHSRMGLMVSFCPCLALERHSYSRLRSTGYFE